MSDHLQRIITEAIALGANKCPPSPHACPACEIVYLADELHANPLPFILSQLPEAKWEEPKENYWVWYAGLCGRYKCFSFAANRGKWVAVCDHIRFGEFDSLESGQAACRADFERRVGEIFQAPAVLAKADKIGGANG